jgi:hypothetical protein
MLRCMRYHYFLNGGICPCSGKICSKKFNLCKNYRPKNARIRDYRRMLKTSKISGVYDKHMKYKVLVYKNSNIYKKYYKKKYKTW